MMMKTAKGVEVPEDSADGIRENAEAVAAFEAMPPARSHRDGQHGLHHH
jgi:hypothetical protein